MVLRITDPATCGATRRIGDDDVHCPGGERRTYRVGAHQDRARRGRGGCVSAPVSAQGDVAGRHDQPGRVQVPTDDQSNVGGEVRQLGTDRTRHIGDHGRCRPTRTGGGTGAVIQGIPDHPGTLGSDQ